jgi:sterol 3beta-glucosyltransferase
MVPTRQYPSLIVYGKANLGGTFNLLTHKFFQRMMWGTGSTPVKQFWKQRFGTTPAGFENFFLHLERSKYPIVVSGSPAIFPPPENCPDHIHYTGYWFYDEDEQWEPSTALTTFLDNGPKPVYIGFGSMGNPNETAETTRIAIEALQKTNQRGILATGWSGMEIKENLPDSIFTLDAAPHNWLFPRMAAVVHHGGAGTSAAGFRPGVPCVIVPHGMDQFAWGIRAHELGVGSKPIPRKNLTVEKLADAIQDVLSSTCQVKAAELGTVIQSENGADKAAQVILRSLR